MIYIGIDNGKTGRIGIIDQINNECNNYELPLKLEKSWQKGRDISRLDWEAMDDLLLEFGEVEGYIHCMLDAPFNNNINFKMSVNNNRLYAELLLYCDMRKTHCRGYYNSWNNIRIER